MGNVYQDLIKPSITSSYYLFCLTKWSKTKRYAVNCHIIQKKLQILTIEKL